MLRQGYRRLGLEAGTVERCGSAQATGFILIALFPPLPSSARFP